MDQVHIIRHKVLVEGKSQRQVASELGKSRNTVRKYVREEEPRYRKSRVPRRKPVLEVVGPRLDELLEGWSGRQTRKQRLTSTRLHAQLVSEGFVISESTVRVYFREWKRKRAEVFVPLVHRPGDSAQVDFFEATVELGGVRRKVWMFLMRLMHSGRDFACLYERQDQVSFLDGHVRAFAHFGGIPQRCVYDNLSAAVKRVLFPGRELTDRFRALCSHYLFEPCFARVGTGHDKGGVEARGRGIRLQHLVPIPRGDSLATMNDELLGRLESQAQTKRNRQGQTVMERFTAEAQALSPVPETSFEPRLAKMVNATRKALVVLGRETYSLPSHWHSLDVTAYVGAADVRFVCRGEIATRKRPGRNKANIKYRDYLGELSRKPQALRQVHPEVLGELGAPWQTLWRLLEAVHGGRETARLVARLLAAVTVHGEEPMRAALSPVLAGHGRLRRARRVPSDAPTEIAVPEPLKQYDIESAKATDYDQLLLEVAS